MLQLPLHIKSYITSLTLFFVSLHSEVSRHSPKIPPLKLLAIYATHNALQSSKSTEAMLKLLTLAVQPQLQRSHCFDDYSFARPTGSQFTLVIKLSTQQYAYLNSIAIADKVEIITQARLGYTLPKSPSY